MRGDIGTAAVVVAWGLTLLALAAAPARAEQWQIQPNANLELSYDDNVRLVPVDAQSSLVANARAAVRASRRTEASDIGLAAGIDLSRYSDVSDLDNTSGFVGLNAAIRGERNRFGLNVLFDSQSTLTSEVATTGLVQINKQRNQFVVSPSWTYLLSERAFVDLGLRYTDVSYQDVQLSPLFNYWVGTASLGGGYRLSERGGLTGQLEFGRYEAQKVGSEYNNFGAQVGADYLVSETISLGALIGIRRTEATFAGADGGSVSQDGTGPTYVLNLSKRLEAGGNVRLQARRELAPSGTGEVLDTTGLTLGLDYPISPRWRFGLNVTGYKNRAPEGEAGGGDRKYAEATPRIVYEISPSWNITAGYRYRWQGQERDELPDIAQSNAVYLTLGWTQPWDL